MTRTMVIAFMMVAGCGGRAELEDDDTGEARGELVRLCGMAPAPNERSEYSCLFSRFDPARGAYTRLDVDLRFTLRQSSVDQHAVGTFEQDVATCDHVFERSAPIDVTYGGCNRVGLSGGEEEYVHFVVGPPDKPSATCDAIATLDGLDASGRPKKILSGNCSTGFGFYCGPRQPDCVYRR
jgi:hypothetical protein